MRHPLLLAALLTGGCLTRGAREGPPPGDPAHNLVRDALHEDIQASFQRHFQKAHPNAKIYAWSGGGSSGPSYWGATVVCRSADDERGRVLAAAECKAILTGVQADASSILARTGVDVGRESAVEVADGANPEAKFVIRYTRKHGEVGGEVVGWIAPDDGPGEPWTRLQVTQREWVRK